MFSRLLQASVRAGAQRLAAAPRLVNVSPNVITLVGLGTTLVAAVLIAINLLLPAGLVLLLAGSMDILDGAQVFLIAAALLGSLLGSYVRARAQSLGFTCDGGWFARPERVVVTALGLVLGQLTIVLWILAIATNVTAIQRIYLVWTQHRAQLNLESALGEVVEAGPPIPPVKPRRGAAPS